MEALKSGFGGIDIAAQPRYHNEEVLRSIIQDRSFTRGDALFSACLTLSFFEDVRIIV